jgi:hypothetical protein
MATEINPATVSKLAKIVKANPGNSEKFYSDKSGIAMGQILRHLVLAELEADPSLKMPATGPAIKKAREAGVRWPRIAARTGLSESAAKELFESHTGLSARDSYTGRGRNFSGTAASPKAAKSGVKVQAGRGTSGRRGAAAAKTGTASSGRRGAVAGGRSGAKASGPIKRGTRASAKQPDPK